MTEPSEPSTPAPSTTSRPAPTRGGRSALVLILVRGAIGLVLLVIASGIFGVLRMNAPEPPKSDESAVRPTVSFMTVIPVEAPRTWEAFGTARAKSAADVGVEVAGVVEERPDSIEAGNAVRAGDVILRIAGREFRDIVDQSRGRIAALEADLAGLATEMESTQETLALASEAVEITRTELKRFQDAQSSAGINQIELDRLRRQLTDFRRQETEFQRQLDLIPARRARIDAQLQQERAAERLALLNVERTEVRAPIDGVLQEVLVDDGERVAPGQTVARIVDLSRIEVPVRAPLAASSRLRTGDRVRLSTGGLAPATWTGSIERIAPEASSSTRTVTVFVIVEQDPASVSDETLRPGQFLSAQLFSAQTQARVVLPRSCIIDDRVTLLDEDDAVRFADVEILYHLEGNFPALHPTETQWTAVAGPIGAGDRVITAGLDALTLGMKLDPLPVTETRTDASYASTNGGDAS